MRWTPRRRPTPVPDYAAALDGNVRGLKIGLPSEYFEQLASETGDLIHRAVDVLKTLGCEVRDIRLPHTPYAIATYYIIATAEASANLARYDGVRYTTRAASARTNADRHVSQNARRRLRSRVQAPHHAGHLRAQRRLLRRVLSEGPEDARPDRARLSQTHSPKSTRSSRPCRRSPRSSSAKRWTIRSRCICRIFSPSPARSREFRA